jgi:DNA-binding MarR family transcriptional regulator
MRARAYNCAGTRIWYAATVKAPPSKPLLISLDQVDGWWALLFTHATVTARIDAVLMERHRISFSTCEILCRLQESEPQAVHALASQLVSVSPTRTSRLVQEQIDAGHLRRGADQGDGRVSLISFTETGREYAESVKRTLEESMMKFFVDPLDDEDIAALTRIWTKLEHARD